MDWRKPVGCDSSSCPEVAPYRGLVLVRSSDRPNGVALLSPTELHDLAEAYQRGDYADILGAAVD